MSRISNRDTSMYRSDRHWGTQSELTFVRGLGNWSRSLADRDQLLRNYLYSMKHRHDWGAINPREVKQEVERLLQAGDE